MLDLPTLAFPAGAAAIDPPLVERPVSGVRVKAGFPSPAEDFLDDRIDLNRYLVTNSPATFFYRACGSSMRQAGILDGDLLLIDRSVTKVGHGDVVVAVWDGNEPVCKILRVCGDHVELHSASPDFAPIVFEPGAEVEVFKVTGVVRNLRDRGRHVRTG